MATYGTNIIADFDCTVDVDMAIIKIIQSKYNNTSYMKENVLNADDYFLKCLLLLRTNINPLTVILKNEYLNSADDLYKDILETNNIYDYLSPSVIHALLNMYTITDGVIKCVVLCKNQQEEQYIKSIEGNKVNTIIGEYPKVNVSSYDSFFVKDYKNILKYKNLKGKHIYIPTYAFNFEKEDDEMPLLSVSAEVADINIIKTLCPYANFTLPPKEKN